MKKVKIKPTFRFFLITLLLLPFGISLQAQETVAVISHQYSPYQNADKSGFQNDLVREAFKAAGLNADISIVPPQRTIADFYNGKFAVCADGETLNDAKLNESLKVKKQVYWNVPIGLMYYKPNLKPEQVKALETARKPSEVDGTLKILSYGGYNPFNEAGYKSQVDIKSDSPEQTASMVRAGRYDLGFEVLGVTPYFVKKGNYGELKDWGFLSMWIYAPQYIAFNGTHPKGDFYDKKFNEGLSIIKKNGVYIAIYEKLYGKNNVPMSAISDPNKEIPKSDMKKVVEDSKFDMAKFLRQKRDAMGSIIEYVD